GRRFGYFPGTRSFRAMVDPAFDHVDIGSGERITPEGHAWLGLAFEHEDQPALIALAGNDGRSVRATLDERIIAVHHQAAHLGRAAVAPQTFLLKDRHDLAGVSRD